MASILVVTSAALCASACRSREGAAAPPRASVTRSWAAVSAPRVESRILATAKLCVGRSGWRGAGGGTLVLEEPRRILPLEHGRYLVSFDEVPVTLRVPNGLDIYVEPGENRCERAPSE